MYEVIFGEAIEMRDEAVEFSAQDGARGRIVDALRM
jgi:hypothetical protein